MISTFRSLTVRNYQYWFAGALVSNVGSWMQRTAQDWIVLTELTNHDAAAVGILTALQFGPQLLLTPIAGLVADRVSRRRILLVTQTLMALLGFVLGFWLLFGAPTIMHVYVLGLLSGIVGAFDTPARQVFVSDLVPQKVVGNAVALNSTSFNLSRLAGPAVAGVLIVMLGSGWVFIVNGLTFVPVIIAILAIRPAEFYTKPVDATPSTARRAGLLDGWRYIRSRSDLQLIMVMVGIVGMLGLNFAVVIPSMITMSFSADASIYGVVSSVMGIGSLVGALITASREVPRLRNIVAGAMGFSLTALGAAIAPSVVTFTIALVALGLSTQTMLSSANGYVQITSQDDVRGRVMAIYMAVLMGGTPIGAPLVGWIANAYGPRWGMGIASASGVLAVGAAVCWLLFTRHGRVHRNRGGGLRRPFVFEYVRTSPIALPALTGQVATVVSAAKRPSNDCVRSPRLERCENITAQCSSAMESSTASKGPLTRRGSTRSRMKRPAH